MKAETLREFFVSSLFSSCVFGLMLQFMIIQQDLESTTNNILSLSETGEDANPHLPADTSEDEDEDMFYHHPVFRPKILAHHSLTPTAADERIIHLGMIIKNVGSGSAKANGLKKQFVVLLNSILEQRAKMKSRSQVLGGGSTPLQNVHVTILTDFKSAGPIERIIKNSLAVRGGIGDEEEEWFSYHFFDIKSISSRFSSTIADLRPHFTSTSEEAKKYTDDLFMVAPFYHRIFPYRKFIMLDVDLRFRIDVGELFALYDKFEDSNLIGVGNDLAPHYYHVLRFFRESHPGTLIGDPGRFQGFNTGVVLFNLDKMRKSELYNSIVENKAGIVDKLAEKYQFKSHLGDQCMFTLLGLEFPSLFHILPCEFNYQLDTTMYALPWKGIFNDYHSCQSVPKIFHGNGGTLIPEEDDPFFWGLNSTTENGT